MKNAYVFYAAMTFLVCYLAWTLITGCSQSSNLNGSSDCHVTADSTVACGQNEFEVIGK